MPTWDPAWAPAVTPQRLPERIIEKAVKGMLPKGRLGRDIRLHLKVRGVGGTGCRPGRPAPVPGADASGWHRQLLRLACSGLGTPAVLNVCKQANRR
jgi:hypothetical protein